MKAFEQHGGKVVEANQRFKHVMALTTDPRDRSAGVVRCITSREGDVAVRGFTDRSELFKAQGSSLEHFEVTEPLKINNQEAILRDIGGEEYDHLGLEDPDLVIGDDGLLHMYCTIPFISKDKSKRHSLVHLGHAIGKDLNSLEMTMPVLQAERDNYENARAKEVSIAPLNSQGFRYNLFESHDKLQNEDETYSTLRIAVAKNPGGPWKFGPTVFHPAEHGLAWIGGHASPGPLLPPSFLGLGEGKRLGIINGREANRYEAGKTLYGTFSVGLFIYDYEHGRIDWVSPKPLIRDSEARTITFASDFIETAPGEGILYAHVDDSFVRAYTLFADGIRELLP